MSEEKEQENICVEWIVKRAMSGDLCITKEQLTKIMMLYGDDQTQLRIDWTEKKIRLTGFNIEFTWAGEENDT